MKINQNVKKLLLFFWLGPLLFFINTYNSSATEMTFVIHRDGLYDYYDPLKGIHIKDTSQMMVKKVIQFAKKFCKEQDPHCHIKIIQLLAKGKISHKTITLKKEVSFSSNRRFFFYFGHTLPLHSNNDRVITYNVPPSLPYLIEHFMHDTEGNKKFFDLAFFSSCSNGKDDLFFDLLRPYARVVFASLSDHPLLQFAFAGVANYHSPSDIPRWMGEIDADMKAKQANPQRSYPFVFKHFVDQDHTPTYVVGQ